MGVQGHGIGAFCPAPFPRAVGPEDGSRPRPWRVPESWGQLWVSPGLALRGAVTTRCWGGTPGGFPAGNSALSWPCQGRAVIFHPAWRRGNTPRHGKSLEGKKEEKETLGQGSLAGSQGEERLQVHPLYTAQDPRTPLTSPPGSFVQPPRNIPPREPPEPLHGASPGHCLAETQPPWGHTHLYG